MSVLQKNIKWQLPSLSLLGLMIHVFVLHQFAALSWNDALIDSTVHMLLLTLAAWGILLLINSYPTRVGILVYAIIIATVLSLALMYAGWFFMKLLPGSEANYLNWLWETIPFRFIIIWLVCGWVATYAALQKQSVELENKFKQQATAAALLKEAELYKLRQQLQPHFLYNSLNSISALTMVAPEKAQDMIGRLSEFLRSSVRKEAKDKIPIADELSYIEAYLAIEAIRFGDRLQIAFEKEYTDDAEIPPFLVQPVLENAIKFGLYGRTGAVTIGLHIALNNRMLTITTTNPYDPQSAPPRGTGFGLEGIRRRLYLLYARTDLLEIVKDGQCFTTILKIPQTDV